MSGHSQGTSLQSTQQKSTKHHPPSSWPLSPYKRAGQGSTKGERKKRSTRPHNNRQQEIDTSSNHPCPFFLFLRLGLGALSRLLVTLHEHFGARKYKFLPPVGRRAFFCPNQDKPPCILLTSSSRKETQHLLIGLGPSGPNTDT
jgi:hypothetical protein